MQQFFWVETLIFLCVIIRQCKNSLQILINKLIYGVKVQAFEKKI